MKLRKKTLIILASCWILAFGLITVISIFILETQFTQIEEKFIYSSFARINEAVQNKINNLERINKDWTPWDDSYLFMQNKNPTFIKSNLTGSVFNDTKVDLFLFLNMDGTAFYSMYYDLATQKFLNLPSDLDSLIKKNKLFFPKNTEDTIKGLLLLNNQVWIIAANYILPTDKKSAPDGVFLNGMKLDSVQIEDLKNATELPIQIFTINDVNQDPELKDIADKTEQLGKYFEYAEDHVNAYIMLKDIFGANIALLSAKMPHDIYLQGKKTIRTYIICLFFIAILITCIIMILLGRFITNRLESIENQITSVDLTKNSSSRINISGDDELTNVASSVNGMLEIIEASQTDLEKRIKQRTQELLVSKKALIKNREKLALTRYDTLTGLPNRTFFYDLLQEAIKDAKRNNKKLAIMFLDLDHFKYINDTLGHHIGDEVLIKVGVILKNTLRESDLLARLGGDEFIICLKNLTDPTDARVAAEKIIRVFTKPLQLSTRQFSISTSIGISIYPDDDKSADKLIKNADFAMYRAKAKSRNTYQFFTRALDQLVEKKLEMEYNLREAINTGQIEAFFQPIIRLSDNALTSVEALARWNHPEQGIIPPTDFIPVAEETGLIHLLGELIVKDVATKQKLLFEKFGFNITIAINFSAVQFNGPDFINNMHSYIEKYELNPQKITIEITETAIMEHIDEVVKKINELKVLGFHLSIDDFGTGYSSLSYLKTFKVDYIKIDKSFLADLEISSANQSIVSAIIFLSHSLGIKVIAEGVENNFELTFLKENKCDMAQGFLFGKAESFNSFIDKFVNNRSLPK